MKEEHKKVVIVGAGMAGLTAAAYLLRENYNVLLLEKNNRCGGLLGTFELGGFFFDTGPRAFINSGILKPMLKDLGIELELLENKISIGVEDQMFRVNSMDSLQDYHNLLDQLYPADKPEIEKIIAIMRELSEYTRVLYEFDNPNFNNQLRDRKFVFKKLIPWTFKFLHALRKFNQFNTPMEQFLRRYTSNQSLIDTIIQHFFRKTPAYFALGYFYVYLDYFYPKGGTGVLADILRNKVLEDGGEIQLGKQIVAIDPTRSIVTDANGDSYPFDHLIWAADLKTLYRNINFTGMEDPIAAQIKAERERMEKGKGAESVFILFLAVDRPPSYFEERGGCHFFYTPSKQGLGTFNWDFRQDLIHSFEEKTRQEVMDWLDQYCDLNTYEVSVPVLRDDSLAPEGQTGLMISCLMDYDIVSKIDQAGWHEEFKQGIEKRIINIFSGTIFKNLNDDILFSRSSSPISIKNVSASSEGAITGWSFETPVPVVNQLKDIPKSVQTPIPGVLQAGQWAYSPAGVPIAMITGWYAYKNIIKHSK